MQHIRNFCIIAHIDHGKSTLADRLLEKTGTIAERDMQAQLLDDMDLERERGITIKSHAIQMMYPYKGIEYMLNLIDTPGHVDFTYEVSRAIAACEGVILVVDAAQGIEAQTIANLYLALAENLTVIPVLNKIDLPNARPEEVAEEIIQLIGCNAEDILHVSGKEGTGVEELLKEIIERIPSPTGSLQAPFQAMVFDAVYNSFRGVEVYFRIFNGKVKKGDRITFLQSDKEYVVDEIGVLQLDRIPKNEVSAGQVGYLSASIKEAGEVKIGATLTHVDHRCEEMVKGFQDPKPMLFAGIYPVIGSDYELLRTHLTKLKLNDPSLVWEPETSAALGFGFRCGFLGMLHMEIIQERLTREFGVDVIATAPSVSFKVATKQGENLIVDSPANMPPLGDIALIKEPIVYAQIITKDLYVGKIMQLCMERRGVLKGQVHLTSDRVELSFELPLLEVAFDFFDRLKSISKGYASFDYRLLGYEPGDLVKLDILLKGEKVDALSVIVHRTKAYRWGKRVCEKMKELIPRHLFELPIQAAIGNKVVARETIKALRKNVIAKCYGGDISRKRKLLEKQKAGKKRMKQVGSVEVPQEAFIALLKVDD